MEYMQKYMVVAFCEFHYCVVGSINTHTDIPLLIFICIFNICNNYIFLDFGNYIFCNFGINISKCFLIYPLSSNVLNSINKDCNSREASHEILKWQ